MKKQITLRLEEELIEELEKEYKPLGINIQTYITMLINKRDKEG